MSGSRCLPEPLPPARFSPVATQARIGRKTTTARRPAIALDVARAAEACLQVPELVDLASVSVSGCVAVLEAALVSKPAPEHESDPLSVERTNRSVVVNTLLEHVHAAALAELEAAEAAVALRAGLRGRTFRSSAAQLLALRRAGIRLERLDDEALRPFRRRVAVRELERVRAAIEREWWVRSGPLREDIAAAWSQGTARDGALAVTTQAFASRGVDAERLATALIYFEAGRHLGLVKQQANKMAQAYTGYCAEDLFGWGWKGLVVALRGYDPTHSAFSTYAVTRIVGHIQDGVRAESPIPKRLGTFSRKATAVEERLSIALGRNPSAEETAAEMCRVRLLHELGRTPTLAEVTARAHEELAQLKLRPRLAVPVAIDESAGWEGDGIVIADGGLDPADEAIAEVLRAEIEAALDALPSEEAEAVRLLDYESLSYEEARERTGASRRQLQQRRTRGRQRLAQSLASWA